MTADVLVSGALALVEPMCNTVAYYFHEKVWARRDTGKQTEPSDPQLVRA